MSIPRDGRSRSANDETASDRISVALAQARRLIRFGVPVFPARVDENGNPDRDDHRWSRWQRYPADLDVLSSYRPGDSLSAVCGITYDVIDIDPRNGGKFSFHRMSEELGDLGPVVYGKVRTPSGGTHLYIAALGIGKHTNFMPGIDLQGGMPDGSSRGFVFLPPTIRPVKGLDGDGGVISGEDAVDRIRMGTYRWTDPIHKPGGDASSEELTAYILAAVESKRSTKVTAGTREDADKLREACKRAEAGGQRAALLRYVHELERRGYAKEDILLLLHSLAAEMPVFDKRRPWYPVRGNPDRELLTLFHRPGTIIPDAEPGELDGLEGPSVARVLPSGLTSFAEVDRGLTRWLWSRYLIVGGISMIDGDAGQGKSAVSLDIGARLTNNDLMPDGTEIKSDGSGAVLLLAPEDSDSVTAGRLEAAGADMKLVFRPALTLRKKKGQRDAKAYSGNELLSFPKSIEKVRGWINAYNIRLVIVDPISAFLDEDVNSNNDASVRRALAPLAHALGQMDCSALFIRHFNKDTTKEARHRGGGSVAFGAIVRVHMIVGEVPEESRDGLDPANRVYAISQVKNNQLERKPDHALAYTIEDSDVVADTEGNMAPRVRWLGEIKISPDELTAGPDRRRGPNPMVQDEIISALTEMFQTVPVWDSKEALNELRNAGITANRETIAKARNRMGVVARQRREKGHQGVAGWEWVVPGKSKVELDGEEG